MNEAETIALQDRETRASSFGRGLRLLLGGVLIADVVPVYARMGWAFAAASLAIAALLIVAYGLAHLVISKYLGSLNRWVGAVGAVALLVAVYVAGNPGGILFGRGEGELGAITFLGASLLVAAIRGDAGCEVMSFPAMLLRERTRLACVLFSPLDALEKKLRRQSR